MDYTPMAGLHFEVLKEPRPVDVPAGTIEIVEFFWYGCPHSYAMAPLVDAWMKRQVNVSFTRVAANLRDGFLPHTAMFYALAELGVLDKLHLEIFRAINVDRNLLVAPDVQAEFAAAHGVDKDEYLDAYNSSHVQNESKQARLKVESYAIEAFPTYVVHGQWRIKPTHFQLPENTMEVLDYLLTQTA